MPQRVSRISSSLTIIPIHVCHHGKLKVSVACTENAVCAHTALHASHSKILPSKLTKGFLLDPLELGQHL